MKIAWLVNNINQCGGIEQVVCGLSNYFCDSLGYQVEIISINSRHSNVFFPLSPSVKVRHCQLDWREQTRRKLNHVVRTVMGDLESDVLLTCHSPISIAVLINRNVFRGKIIVTQHCACDFESSKRQLINAIMYRFADRLVVLTEDDKRKYQRRGCRAEVIPNAMYKTVKSRSSLDRKVLLAAGRLTAIKGFDMLLSAFAKIAAKNPDWKLCICGDGEQAELLKEMTDNLGISDQVIFPGFVENIADYMYDASCFVISSRSEGFSLVLLEAMAHGLPIVSYDLPAIKEITGGQAALLAPCGDVDALAQRIDHMFASDKLRHALGQQAFEISEKFKVPEIAMRWIDLFEELLK